MRITLGKCAVWVLVLLAVSLMLNLHFQFVHTEEGGGEDRLKIDKTVMDKTSESLADIMNSIQNFKDTVYSVSTEPVDSVVPAVETPVSIEKPNISPGAEPIDPSLTKKGSNPELVTPVLVKPTRVAAAPTEAAKPRKNPPRVLAEMKPVQISDNYRQVFDNHVSKYFPADIPLDAYMRRTSRTKQCAGKPLFVTMARVKSDLYWQLIENFFFTM